MIRGDGKSRGWKIEDVVNRVGLVNRKDEKEGL